MNDVKNSPITKIAGIVTLIGSLIMGVLFVEDRYVHAADFITYKTEVSTQFNKRIDNMEIKQIQEKIFIINFKIQKGTATPLDKALLERYKQELLSLRKTS